MYQQLDAKQWYLPHISMEIHVPQSCNEPLIYGYQDIHDSHLVTEFQCIYIWRWHMSESVIRADSRLAPSQ